ncbi:DEAD/DEAH box helicase [Candidatus Dojkabacteria bacterium]|nr:DEAD/DEAH box helicase [Candidatus Dojkabacteria bacterium]
MELDLTKKITFSNAKILFVSGLVTHLQSLFIQQFKNSFKFNFLYSKQNNLDIRKYFDSLEYIDNKEHKYTLSGLEVTLEEFRFEKIDKVTSLGQYSKKGDLVSIWPIGYQHPVRISYFGDDIEFIEIFDEIYNTKIENTDGVILGNISKLPDKVDWYEMVLSGYDNIQKDFHLIFSQNNIESKVDNIIDFDFSYPQLFYKRFDILENELTRLKDNGWTIQIYSRHREELTEGLRDYLLSETRSSDFEKVLKELPAGFSSNEYKILFLTDRELYGTIFLQKERKRINSKQAQKLLSQLEGEIGINDFVVHEDHGIGIYKGLQQENIIETKIVDFKNIQETIVRDYLKISYAEGDELLVPISQLHKITKYIATTDQDPEITRLHKGNWSVAIRKAKKAINLIARDLVEHYAKLNLVETTATPFHDSKDYIDFEQNFTYEETRDQLSAITDIKKDLAQEKPMNRLIVGDVGFGKTEVAMRAAFKIVEQGKQVAVLCPTTVLAIQHYKVFKDRFKDFPFNISYISRFKSPSENKKTIIDASEGKVDILVGTHRLLSSDVEFKDLGLIVVDEEQKFGVKQKEKIRKLQYGAHSLTLSATPIPRTLSMALSQIQDISIIATPPMNRRSVKTEVSKLDWNKIAQEIQFEIKRNGQIYFLHNKIETINSIQQRLHELLPDARLVIGHGQMSGKSLDEVITKFYEKAFDVLICTTIIENGIDMPNVNTIIINDGQNFGLGQLYQLRGRVGRSDKQAFCYIYYKGKNIDHTSSVNLQSTSGAYNMEQETKNLEDDEKSKKDKKKVKYIERLKAILESQELGSGFKLASRDLEIRGAGNLLGIQQHGNIANVGLALYMQMLAEEIERLKELSKYEKL